MTMLTDVLVETDEAEVTGWWDDADLEDDRLHKISEQASRMFLALLERHHTYGAGEMVLPEKRRAA